MNDTLIQSFLIKCKVKALTNSLILQSNLKIEVYELDYIDCCRII